MQIRRQIQGLERYRQRRVVHRLGHFYVTSRERDVALRKPFFGGVPRYIGFTAEDAAGFGGLRHKRFQHRQIEAVEIHHRAPFRARINSLRHAQLGVRVSPAVWPDTDFLLGVAVIQRDGTGERKRPHRRGEAGIIQNPFPALLLAVETARQMQLTRNRLALHAQLEVVLLLAAFCVQRHQADIHLRLGNTLNAQI
ncbi:hypothetical protein D3C87_1596670 [compost metagenome]